MYIEKRPVEDTKRPIYIEKRPVEDTYQKELRKRPSKDNYLEHLAEKLASRVIRFHERVKRNLCILKRDI